MAAPLTEQILDRAPDAVISMDVGGRVTYWNPRAEEMFGVRREDALGAKVADLIVPERHRAAHIAGIERFLQEGTGPLLNRRIEIEALRADGTEFPAQLTVSAVREDDGWNFHQHHSRQETYAKLSQRSSLHSYQGHRGPLRLTRSPRRAVLLLPPANCTAAFARRPGPVSIPSP